MKAFPIILIVFTLRTHHVPNQVSASALRNEVHIRGMKLQNRLVLASTSRVALFMPNWGNASFQEKLETQIRVDGKFAKTGVGMLVTGLQELLTDELLSITDAQLMRWAEAATYFKSNRAIVQIGDAGIRRGVATLSELEIEHFVSNMITFACRIDSSGWDGVEIHMGQGLLINQFLSPQNNERKDPYGGSVQNRLRIVTQIVVGIHRCRGPNFIISALINAGDSSSDPDALDENEWLLIARELSRMPVDMFHITGGTPDAVFRATVQEGVFADFASKVKQFIQQPVCVTGGYQTVQHMNSDIMLKRADLIGVSRPVIYGGKPFVDGCLHNASYRFHMDYSKTRVPDYYREVNDKWT